MSSGYGEYEQSAPYLHVFSLPMWQSLKPRLVAVLSCVDPRAGTILELGPGSGIGTEIVLDAVPGAPVLAAEPSAVLRGILLARLAGRSDADRLTVYPSGAASIPLPERLAAVIGLHMIGHLAPAQRRKLWSALATRLSPGAPVVINVQPPDTATAVLPTPPITVTQGRLIYRGTGSAVPTGPDSIRWLMSYATLDGGEVIDEVSAQYDWWIVSADRLAAELSAAGLIIDGTDDDLVLAHSPRHRERVVLQESLQAPQARSVS